MDVLKQLIITKMDNENDFEGRKKESRLNVNLGLSNIINCPILK